MASSTILGGDFTVDYDLKTITHTTGTTVYTVNALYSALQDLFDELAQLDDPVPMSAQTPTEYTLINSWFMDEPSFQYLKGGAIKTLGWNQGATYPTGVRVLTFNSSGYVNLTGTDIGLPVVGTTTADSGTLLFYDNTLRIWWVRADALDDTFDTSEEVTVTGGTDTSGNSTTAAAVTGEHVFANIYSLGTIEGGGYTLSGAHTSGGGTVTINETPDVNLPTSGYIHVTNNSGFEDVYAYSSVTGSVFTLSGTLSDNYNDANAANVYGEIYVVQDSTKLTGWWPFGHLDVLVRITDWDGTEIDVGLITVFLRRYGHLYDHFVIDLSNGGRNAVPLATAKDLNNTTLAATVSAYSDITITFSTGGYSKDLNNGAGSRTYDVSINANNRPLAQVYEYLKYLTRRTSTTQLGDPADNGEEYISAVTTYAPVKASPLGTYAGGTFFGARGVWIENMAADDIKKYQLIDASNTVQLPPNTVTMEVTSIVSGDRIGVFRLTGAGGSILKNQYTLNGAHNTTDTTVTVNTIDSDTPAAGFLRIVDSSNVEYLYQYSSWTGAVFTLDVTAHPTGLAEGHSNGEAVYIPIIDDEATTTSIYNTLIYSSDVPVLIRVRKKGIIPFEQESTITNTGRSVAAIRTTDTIVA